MKAIESFIEGKRQELIEHPFFKTLEQLNSLEEISRFVPELAFGAMTFQDILRVNEDCMKEPYLKKIARHHRLEDGDYRKWLLHDKKYMAGIHQNNSCNKNDTASFDSKESQVMRDMVYVILSEIDRADDEMLNIVILLVVKSSGHLLLKKIAQLVKKTGKDERLKYFSSPHMDIEMAHALFEKEMERKLFERKIPVHIRREALKMVDRCYEAFSQMFDGLIVVCNKRLVQAKQRDNKRATKPMEQPEKQTV